MRFLTIFLLFMTVSCDCHSQDSTHKMYYPGGQLKSFQIRRDSSLVYEKDFYESGKLAGEGLGSIAKGKYIPKQFKMYYENGVLKSNNCDSVLVEYDSVGRMYLHIPKVNGVMNGESQYYLENKLGSVINYKNGKRDGLTIVYDLKTGMKAFEENYKNGIQVGSSKYYDEKGQLQKEVFHQGLLVKVIYYDKNLKPIRTETDSTMHKLDGWKIFRLQ